MPIHKTTVALISGASELFLRIIGHLFHQKQNSEGNTDFISISFIRSAWMHRKSQSLCDLGKALRAPLPVRRAVTGSLLMAEQLHLGIKSAIFDFDT